MATLMQKNAKLQRDVEHLEVKLRIPRHHFKYLEEHGILDEFVQIKHEGNDGGARSALDRAMEIGESKRNKLMQKYTVDSVNQSITLSQSQASPRRALKL